MFNLFKRKKAKTELTDSQLKWNKLWDLWVHGTAESPYRELMTYQSEINNGGHSQYFYNIKNTGNLPKDISVLYGVLPSKLKDNLVIAYKAYLKLEQNESNEEAEAILEECDDIFHDNEQTVIDILEKHLNL